MDTSPDGPKKGTGSADKKPMSFSMGFSKLGQKKKEGGASMQIGEKKDANRISVDSMTLDADSLRKLAAPKQKAQIIIPCIENKWKPEEAVLGVKEEKVKQEDDGKDVKVKQEPKERTAEDEAAAALIADARKRLSSKKSDGDVLAERALKVAPITAAMSEEERLKIDLESRPDDLDLSQPGMIARYDATPVDDFGMGMLMGMGWKPGMGIGRKPQIVEPTLYNMRGYRQGLGADMVKPSGRGPKKFIKPGESREQVVAKPKNVVSSSDSRSKLYKSLEGRMIQVQTMQLKPGALVEILDGEYAKLYGRVARILGPRMVTIRKVVEREKEDDSLPPTLKSDRAKQRRGQGLPEEEEEEDNTPAEVIEEEEEWNMCEVTLNRSGETVEIPRHDFELLDERALPDDHPAFRKGSSILSSSSSSSSSSAVSTPPPSGKKRSRSSSKERDPSKRHKGDRDGSGEKDKERKKKRSRSRSKDKKKKKDKNRDREKEKDRGGKKQDDKAKERITWVVPHIRVRVVSKSLGSGKYYQQKGRVEDVIDQYRFTLIMDGSGKVVEGVTQRNVETALPKAGGKVRVLAGEYKGEVGQLLERDSSTGRGVVRLDSELTSVVISFDDMAEWTGGNE